MMQSTIDNHPQKTEIVAAIKAGHSLRAIAGQFNVSKDAVARFKQWVPMKRTPEPEPTNPTSEPEPKGTEISMSGFNELKAETRRRQVEMDNLIHALEAAEKAVKEANSLISIAARSGDARKLAEARRFAQERIAERDCAEIAATQARVEWCRAEAAEHNPGIDAACVVLADLEKQKADAQARLRQVEAELKEIEAQLPGAKQTLQRLQNTKNEVMKGYHRAQTEYQAAIQRASEVGAGKVA